MSLRLSGLLNVMISYMSWEEKRRSAGDVQLTFGASRMLIQEVSEIPNLGMYSNPAILSRAMFL